MTGTNDRIRPDHVAIYIRWSTDDQGDGTTAAVQLEGCRHYLLSQGWTYRPELVFLDDGCSGGDLDRPALGRLREAVRQGDVDCLVLFKIDRLSRNVVDTVNLVLREWEGRCHVKSAREAIDTSTPAGKMFFYTLVSFAEWERSVIRDRTLSGKLRRLHEGKNPGFRPPYGLCTGASPGSFALVESEARVVRFIYDAYERGDGYQAIAADLNRRGIPFREGRSWSARTVADMLQNPLYAGRLVYGRRTANPRRHQGGPRQIRNPDAPIEVLDAPVPPILPAERFDQVQELRAQRAHSRGGNRSQRSAHLLTGLLRCRCDASLVGVKGPSGDYYVCSGKRTRGPAYCDAAHIRQEELDRWLVNRLLARYGPRLRSPRFRAAADAARRSEEQAVQAGLAEVDRELRRLDRELARIGRAYRQEDLSLAEYREHREMVAGDRAALLDRQERLTAERARLAAEPLAPPTPGGAQNPGDPQDPEGAQNPGASGLRGPQLWDRLPHPVRKRILRSLIRGLTVYRAPRSSTVSYQVQWLGG